MEDENLHPDFRQTRSEASIQWRSNSQSDTEQDDPSDNPARPSKQRRTRKTPPPLDKETPRFAFYDKAKKQLGKPTSVLFLLVQLIETHLANGEMLSNSTSSILGSLAMMKLTLREMTSGHLG